MFLARPQQFLTYGINLDFRAMKRMSSRIPAANTPDFTSLEKQHSA
jgi:hypothetical protein